MKKTVWIIVGVILNVSIIGLLGSCSESRSSKNKEKQFDVLGFYDSRHQILELRKDGTFYLDIAIYHEKTLDAAVRAGKNEQERKEIIQERRACEAFPDIITPGVTGKWKIEGNSVVLTIGSGATLRGKIIESKINPGTVGIIGESPEREWFRTSQKAVRDLYVKYGR